MKFAKLSHHSDGLLQAVGLTIYYALVGVLIRDGER